MRKIVGVIALGAMVAAAPALAQNDTGREVIRGVLDALLGPAPQPTQPQATATPAQSVVRIDDVLAHSRRDGDRARDKYRHPKETLALFQIEPGMTVVDYVPDTGWYARIIAPYLGPSGRYIGMGPDVSSAPDAVRRYWGGQTEKMATNPAGWNLGAAAQISGFNNDAVPEYLVGTVDRVLIFRE
jgi:predicted methyltransferase